MAAKAWLSTNKILLAGGTAAVTAGAFGVGTLLNGSRESSKQQEKSEEVFSISGVDGRGSDLPIAFPTMVEECSACKQEDIKRLYYILDIATENLDNEYTKDLTAAQKHWQFWLKWRDQRRVPTEETYSKATLQTLKTQYQQWQNKWHQKIDDQVSKLNEESRKQQDREAWERLRNQDIEFLKEKFSEMFGLEKTFRLRRSTESK